MISWMQTHRKYLIVTIWISTIAFVGAGFLSWGAYSFSTDKQNAVAKVGDRTITGSELQSSYNNIYNYYNQMLGGKLTQEKADELKLQDIALNQLVQQTLLLDYADELGITATEDEIVQKLASIDNFKKDGAFEKEIYFKALQAINKKPTEFEADIKKEIIIKKLNRALELPDTELELKTLASSIYLQDDIKATVVKVEDKDIKIDDKELKEFWEQHKNDYMSDKSYTIESIKINAIDVTVDESKLEAFYKENKTKFKGDDDKIQSFEDAKTSVKAKLQQKLAKKEVLKKYLAFKDGKIKADETLTLTAKNSKIPLSKIKATRVGSYIKAIELEDGYLTAKLINIDEPKALAFEDAKQQAHDALFKSKKMELLQERAAAESKVLKDATTFENITREDAKKITILEENEARQFLQHLFSQTEKLGQYIFTDKAIAYEITDQSLSSKETVESHKDDLTKNLKYLKNSLVQNQLIEKLQKRYTIEKY